MDHVIKGWLVKYNVEWKNGVVVKPGAFDQNKVEKVPVLMNTFENTPDNVLGHADLEYREEGVFCTAYVNTDASGEEVIHKIINRPCFMGLHAINISMDGMNLVRAKLTSLRLMYSFDDSSEILEVDGVPYSEFFPEKKE